jgi:hypothetical protein
MEPYSSVNDTKNKDHEPYYRTPACGPEDIVCPGSDSEETPEETRQKRLRYERQARRYLRGHRPVLLSASLRGPFSKETGWINPWSNLRTKRNQGGLRQGPGDVASTRAGQKYPSKQVTHAPRHALDGRKHDSVRERSEKKANGSSAKPASVEKESSLKLGYVNPADVSAWQSKVGTTGRILGEEGSLDAERMKRHGYGDDSMISPRKSDRIEQAPGPADSEARAADSMINHYVQNPAAGHNADFTIGMKRTRDSQWLMGSYVSKRARWDGPTLSSPTPGLAPIPSRNRARRPGGSPEQQSTVQPGIVKFGSMAEQPPQTTLFSAQLEERRTFHSDPADTGFNSTQLDMCQPNIEDGMDELQQAQESSFVSWRSSWKPSRRSLAKIRGRSMSSFEQDDLIAITPHADAMDSPTAFGSSLQAKFTGGTLPKLPRPDNHDSPELETSFVSEVALSSRNLEQFHFKKRKRRTKSSEYGKTSIGDVRPDVTIVKHLLDEDEDCLLGSTSIPVEPQDAPDAILKRDDEFESFTRTPEVSEEDQSKVPEAALDIQDSKHGENPAKMVVPEDDSEFADDTGERSTKAVNCNDAAIPSDPQGLLREEEPLANEIEDSASFNLGEMSFLRAVLRAGNSAQNTPSSRRDSMSVSKKSPDIESDNHLPYLAEFNFGTSKHMPSPKLHRKPPSVPLSSPGPTPTKTPARSKSQPSVRSFGSGQSSSSNRTHNSPHLPELHVSPLGDGQFLPSEDGCHHSNLVSASPGSSSHQIFPQKQVLPESSKPSQELKPSQDPNDFSTQSYNTTPFKSQRSVRWPQSKRKSLGKRDLDDCENLGVPNAGEKAMERIQLELSQMCPSSPQVATPSEDDAVDIESSKKLTLETDKPIPTTEAIEPASPQVSGSKNEYSPDLPGTTAHDEVQMNESEVEISDLSSPDQPPDNYVEEHDDTGNNQLDNSAKEVSEASWEGCGPQSPWAIEFIEPVLVPVSAVEGQVENQVDAFVLSESHNVISLEETSVADQSDNQDISSEWQRVEQPQTPVKIANEPFEELTTSEGPPMSSEVTTSETLTNTQLLVDAATKNPWTTSIKKLSAVKITKRVSFGKSSSQDGEDSQPPIRVRFGPASQSTQEHLQDEDDPNSCAQGMPSLSRKSLNNREFKKILAEVVTSPTYSSPAVAAQAEAFIAADREASIEQEPMTTDTPSNHLKPRSEMDSNLAWRQPEENNMLLNSYMRFQRSSPSPASTPIPGFDMEEALGEAGKFLEDWSVDSELKRANNKASDTNTRDESTGYRGRRLFGLGWV